MRNCPGFPPRSPRNRYVVVVGVSRTISRRGTTWILGMGDPDRLRYGVEARFLQENAHFLYDFVEDAEAPREDRGPDLDRARAGHDVLQGVATRSDPTDADHVDIFAATAAYSSASLPNTEPITTAPAACAFLTSCSYSMTPGFGRPTAFSRPASSSTIVGFGYPSRGFGPILFVTTAPAPAS